jgi:hypothetical protein
LIIASPDGVLSAADSIFALFAVAVFGVLFVVAFLVLAFLPVVFLGLDIILLS